MASVIDLTAPSQAGSGTFGCVVTPALVFTNSLLIDSDNNDDFVTKIGEEDEMKIEQKNNYEIRTKTYETLGVFAVDEIACGIKASDLGPNASDIQTRCAGNAFPPGLVLDLCGIQYPKYAYDFHRYMQLKTGFVSQNFQDQLADFAYKTLSKKLIHLHAAKYFHGDIKSNNCAFMKPVREGVLDPDSIRFADFGTAFFCDPVGTTKAVEQVLANQDYFKKLGPVMTSPNLIEWNELRKLGERPTRKQKQAFLQLVDYICLIGTVSLLFGSLAEQKDFTISLVERVNFEIETKLAK